MFGFSLGRGHRWVCLHTFGPAGHGKRPLNVTPDAAGEWEETEEEFWMRTVERQAGQQEAEGRLKTVALCGDPSTLSPHLFLLSSISLVEPLLVSLLEKVP